MKRVTFIEHQLAPLQNESRAQSKEIDDILDIYEKTVRISLILGCC